MSNLRGAPGYVYPRRTLSPCGWDFIRTHIRSIDRCMRPTRGTHVRALLRGASHEGDHASTACPRVGWAGKFFDQPMIVVVNAMLAEYLRTSSIGFLLHSRKIANILRLRDIADSSKRNTSGNSRLREIAIPRKE